MNLVNLVKDQLGGSVVNQLGGLLGESGAKPNALCLVRFRLFSVV